MADQREKRVELILQQLEELPTLPAVALRVLQVTGDDASSAKEVVELIAADPALTARILQLVRRADAGARCGELTSVHRAVVLLGFEAVRAAVLAVSVFQTFAAAREEQPAATPARREAFWTHSLAVACCAELLAEIAPAGAASGKNAPGAAVHPSDAFICGLLHDLGKLALDAVLPKSFARVVEAADLLRGNIADVERTVIGLDHTIVGKRLAERWQLPVAVRDCAWLHGQQPRSLPATVRQPRLVNLVTLADHLVRERHLGYSGNYTFPVPRQELLDAVGLSGGQVDAALSRLVERMEPRAAALGLGQSSSDELYQQALAQANHELGRVSAQLASRNRKLTARSRYFDALSQFQSTLRPDAGPQAVLQAVARTAVGVLGVARAAAFSLPPGQDFAETVLCDDAGRIVDASLVDLPGMSDVTGDAAIARLPDGLFDSAALGEAPDATEWDEVADAACGFADQGPSDLDPLAPHAGSSAKPQAAADSDATALAESPDAAVEPRPAQPEPGDGPVLPAGESLEWLVAALSPRLPGDKRFWICLEADGACVGGILWGAAAGEAERLSTQAQELSALANGWGLALRAAQVREEARTLAEQLADANRRLHDAQAEVLRSKALLTVAEMAAGAAHEMNNPLAVISGRSQLLARALADPKLKASAQLIHEQSDRLSDIITELMAFARPEPPRVADCDVAVLVRRALSEAKATHLPVDRGIEVTLAEVPAVAVDERQVSAALAEVIENAWHATDARTGHVAVGAGFDPYTRRVVVTVTDDGCGMDEATAKRAFDPFYSNKAAGRRRGLGLAKALRWIEASGGSIRLESRPGQGTRAIVLLPAATAASGAPGADAAPVPTAERKAQ